jgi:hypothetical protein
MKLLAILLAASAMWAQGTVSVNVVVIGNTAKNVTFDGKSVDRGSRTFRVSTGGYNVSWTSNLSGKSYSEPVDIQTNTNVWIEGDKKIVSYSI